MTDSARAKVVRSYSESRPDLARQLEFFERLWATQDGLADRAAAYTPASEEETQRALGTHRTLFALARPEVPLDAYRDAVRAIAALMTDAGLPDEQTAALTGVDLGAAITAEALASALDGFDVFVNDVAGSIDDERIGETLLSFILSEAMTPLLREPAKSAFTAAGKFDWLQWDSGLCPVCGTPASSGVIRDEGDLQGGRRWLECPLCRTSWEYARIRCARCGSRDQTTLAYLFDEQDPGHRIHTCEACHGYTPTVFERDLKRISVAVVEEIVMIPLESVAADRGFTPLGEDQSGAPN